jgi:hypothetical protein
MSKKLRLRLIACKIEWHWLFIMPGRKKGNRMIDGLIAKGQLLNSPKLLALVRQINKHCARVSVLTELYKEIAGIRIFHQNAGEATVFPADNM